jgi:DNA-binding winged helix-turn-helix (wHTH) protein
MMFRVLGPLEVEADDGRLSLPGQRARALLTALLLEPNSVVPGYRLVEALWGEEPPDAPANALQQVVARLRARLGPVGTAIVTRPPGYLLVADATFIDAQRFESDYRAARAVWSTDPARARCSTTRCGCGGDPPLASLPTGSPPCRPRDSRSSGCRRSKTGLRCSCSPAPRPTPSRPRAR